METTTFPDEFLLALREPFSGLSHLAAAVASTLALAVLRRKVRRGGDRARMVTLTFFGLSLVLLFSASALYHLLMAPPAVVNWTRRVDHAAIFILIAGTYTGVCFNLLRGVGRALILLPVWVLGLAGTVEKILFFSLPECFSVSLYVGMGWIGIAAYPLLARVVGHRAMLVLLGGGLAYTGGAVLDFLRWPSPPDGGMGHHEIFHMTVVLGAFLHFAFIARHVASRGPGGEQISPARPSREGPPADSIAV